MITRPCYSFREQAQRSLTFPDGLDQQSIMDRALESAADNIDAQLHRKFYPDDGTRRFDWPNFQYETPWTFSLGRQDLVVLTQIQSPGNSGGSGGVTIPLWQVLLEPVNKKRGFPYTRIELDRSTVAAWGTAPTPQHSIWATGTWGFGADADQVATLAASVASGDTTVTVSDGSKCGPGDVLILGYGRGVAPFPAFLGTAGAVAPYTGERMICYDRAYVATGLTQTGGGCTTDNAADNALAVTGSGALNAGEVVVLDQERMLILQITGGVATVRRGFDGTVLAAHSGAAVYAGRQLSVIRAELGTAAGSYSAPAAVYKHRVPALVRDISIGESVNQALQEGAGYARTVGSGEGQMPAPGVGLADKWDEAMTAYGRKARSGAI